MSTMPAGSVQAIRDLDVGWCYRMSKRMGIRFVAARSENTGSLMSRDHIALQSLHLLRTVYGNRTQIRESYAWLKQHRKTGLFGETI